MVKSQSGGFSKIMNASLVVKDDLEIIIKDLENDLKKLGGSRFLITGAGGFLGFYLVNVLTFWNAKNPDRKILVHACDNFFRGRPQWLEALEESKELTLIEHDITQPLPDELGSFEFIIHAASIASPTFYRKYPIETMDANVNGLRLILDRCVNDESTKGLLYFSTSEIYGDPYKDDIPTPETYRGNVSCTGPRACYDESKRFGETLCTSFSQVHNVPVKIARPFNNYGPGLKISDGRVLPDFCSNIFLNQDIVLLSDGSPTRTFCYVSDAITGYFKILFSGRNGEAYNIGVESPEISMLELAEKVIKIGSDHFGYNGKLIYGKSSEKDYLIDNPQRRCPIIEKAKKELNYKPKVDINNGLLKSMYWYSENLK
jgi:dTDP-glucose 4,6-dehydratase/UDP-glucuronate decarboxylase